MAYKSSIFLSLGLCFLVLFHASFAQIELQQRWESPGQAWGSQQQQGPRLRAKTNCSIDRLTSQEPSPHSQSEAGVILFWDKNRPEFVCAGVEVVKYVIRPKGLLLPAYTSSPVLEYVDQGKGIFGAVIPGCAETYESDLQTSEGQQGQRFIDRHQKLSRIQKGDVRAIPAGVAHWVYNDGDTDLITVALVDTSNNANQLDNNIRKFFLAGNPQQGQQGQQGEQKEAGNIFNGFVDKIIADAFNVNTETARKLTGQQDQRGFIVQAENLQLVAPEFDQQEQQYGRGGSNGLEETLCTMELVTNIASPQRADVYNPRGGRISTLNSNKFPVLNLLQLSAEWGALYKNAILAPHWHVNAHSIIYIIRGSGRIQVVGSRGNSVLDDQVQQGQLIIVPQNFAVIKKADNEGLEWVAFKTNDNAIKSEIAGRISAIRGMPEEVLMNSYQISREEARKLKSNRKESIVFSSSRSQQSLREYV